MRWIMRGIAALAVPAVLAGTALATATGVAATGGGCGSPAGPPVVQVQACINSTPGVDQVNADAWVTWHSGTPPAGCSIIIALENADNGDILARSGVQGCTGGHHLGASRIFFGRLVNVTVINASSVEYQSTTRVFTCQPSAC
jgi:hypothetical protein